MNSHYLATKTANSGDIFATGSVGTIDGDSVVDFTYNQTYSSFPAYMWSNSSDSYTCGYYYWETGTSYGISGSSGTRVGTRLYANQSNVETVSKSVNVLAVVVRRLIQLY